MIYYNLARLLLSHAGFGYKGIILPSYIGIIINHYKDPY